MTAYAAIGGKYLEVTELWGEMKLLANSDDMKFDQELLDGLLYCFVRGGFFSRANEVVKMLERGGMFVDNVFDKGPPPFKLTDNGGKYSTEETIGHITIVV
ncbi:Pentatricopeptide repeat-containing protein [Acorus calamus]|uniref:Pentatricopeptide repeat-containing protein n=1 Tax=Acorus calamus TaxID=4465 RepID=A0AAV9EJ22_ACOCL|nr:Pentatricopeptide repeat-containing protein [Acorus calamus]